MLFLLLHLRHLCLSHWRGSEMGDLDHLHPWAALPTTTAEPTCHTQSGENRRNETGQKRDFTPPHYPAFAKHKICHFFALLLGQESRIFQEKYSVRLQRIHAPPNRPLFGEKMAKKREKDHFFIENPAFSRDKAHHPHTKKSRPFWKKVRPFSNSP